MMPQALARTDRYIVCLFFVLKLCLVLLDELLQLEVYQVIELPPSHPVSQYHNQRHITDLHIIGCLVEIALLETKMVLLAI